MTEDVLDITIASYLESEWEAWREKTEDGEVTFAGSYAIWRDISETFLRKKVWRDIKFDWLKSGSLTSILGRIAQEIKQIQPLELPMRQ